ncbi:MAG: hypothetical protein HZA93_29670 [Verrucomicrobia bacterium]|nr:hypothetical protein [Verrucomicrobiota bacterium]
MRIPPRLRLGFCAALAIARLAATAAPAAELDRVWRIMPVGDSITAVDGGFGNYRIELAAKLAALPVKFEFVGSRSTKAPHGALRHEAYSGRNAEFLAAHFADWFRANPADIILLHSGHNHTVEENPVPGIVRATEEIIRLARAQNPRVIVLLAQVIPAGKLPKYAYLPALNLELARLAPRLHSPNQPVILVDQATGFDWRTDTVADLVHPNTTGAAKMAQRWFEALQSLRLPP